MERTRGGKDHQPVASYRRSSPTGDSNRHGNGDAEHIQSKLGTRTQMKATDAEALPCHHRVGFITVARGSPRWQCAEERDNERGEILALTTPNWRARRGRGRGSQVETGREEVHWEKASTH